MGKNDTRPSKSEPISSGDNEMKTDEIVGLKNQLQTSVADILGYARYSERDDQYVRFLTKLAYDNSSKAFANGNAVHAVTVFSLMFQFAEKEICLFAGNLNGQISAQSDYQGSLNMFLASKGKLKILLQDYDENKRPPLFPLLNYYQKDNAEQICIKKLGKDCDLTDYEYHFCVVDDKMYRLETDLKEYKAIGCFNDTTGFVKTLKEKFNNSFNKSQQVIIP